MAEKEVKIDDEDMVSMSFLLHLEFGQALTVIPFLGDKCKNSDNGTLMATKRTFYL